MIISSNSSPLIALACSDTLFLLNKIFKEVYVPQQVLSEISIKNKPGSEVLLEWSSNRVKTVSNNG